MATRSSNLMVIQKLLHSACRGASWQMGRGVDRAEERPQAPLILRVRTLVLTARAAHASLIGLDAAVGDGARAGRIFGGCRTRREGRLLAGRRLRRHSSAGCA